MLASHCPRCQETFRVPIGVVPEDAQAICPWCHEQFPLSEVLDGLPPVLQVVSSDGSPIEVTGTIGPVGFNDQDANESTYPEDAIDSADNWNLASFDQPSGGDRLSASSVSGAVRPMSVPVRRRKKGSGIRAAIGVVLGAVAAVPIAGGLLMLMGRTPDWGFWPFDGGNGDPGPSIIAAPTGTIGERTYPKRPFGQSLLDSEREATVDPNPQSSALDEILGSGQNNRTDSNRKPPSDSTDEPGQTVPDASTPDGLDAASALKAAAEDEPFVPSKIASAESLATDDTNAPVIDPAKDRSSETKLSINEPPAQDPSLELADFASSFGNDQDIMVDAAERTPESPELPQEPSELDAPGNQNGLVLPDTSLPTSPSIVAPQANRETALTASEGDADEAMTPDVAVTEMPASDLTVPNIPANDIPATDVAATDVAAPRNAAEVQIPSEPLNADKENDRVGESFANRSEADVMASPMVLPPDEPAVDEASDSVETVAPAQEHSSPAREPSVPVADSETVLITTKAAEDLVNQLATFDGPKQDRRALLRDTYLKVVETCQAASPSSQSIKALAKKMAASSIVDDIEAAGLDWIRYSRRTMNGVALVGQAGQADGKVILTLRNGTNIALQQANPIPRDTKVLALGRIVGESAVEALVIEVIR